MKLLILAFALVSSTVFAVETPKRFECGVKTLTASSPKDLRVGDPVRVKLSQNLSVFQVGNKTVRGNAKLSPSGGAYPYVYVLTEDNRMLLTFEMSKSLQNARIRSLSLSTASGGYPVIATLSCAQI